MKKKVLVDEWVEEVIAKEEKVHQRFFGDLAKGFDYAPFERKLLAIHGSDLLERLRPVFSEVVFFPPVKMEQGAGFLDGKWKEPRKWFYKQEAKGSILSPQPDGSFRATGFELWLGNPETGGTVAVIDTRCKPQYGEVSESTKAFISMGCKPRPDDGKEMWQDDKIMQTIIAELRKQKKIAGYKYGPAGSRFGITADETEEQVIPALASELGVEGQSMIIPDGTVQSNYIAQAYPDLPRANDGNTTAWLWFAEAFENSFNRLLGGSTHDGGLSDVGYFHSYLPWDFCTCRFLAVL